MCKPPVRRPPGAEARVQIPPLTLHPVVPRRRETRTLLRGRGQGDQRLARRLRVEHRYLLHGRLHDRVHAARGLQVAERLDRVRGGQHQIAGGGGFVERGVIGNLDESLVRAAQRMRQPVGM